MLITFHGFSPGQPPYGRQALFLVAGDGPLTRAEVEKLGHKIPPEAEEAEVNARHTWNNSAPGDDNLGVFHPDHKG